LCFQHFVAFCFNCGKIYIGSNGKESARNAGDVGWIPGSGRSLWRREGLPTPVFLPGEPGEPGGPQSIGSQRVGHD